MTTPQSKTALLFPGQGAQAVGMGKDLAAAYPKAADVFKRADQILDMSLSRICFEGPQEELNRTDISQPAILAHSWAVVEVLREHGPGRALLDGANACAGLSLGEYSALAAAGSIAWEDALKLVRARGQYMQQACDASPSTMASILGLEEDKLGEVCKRASVKGVCVMANFNAEGQIVIAGTKEAVALACSLAKDAGARRCIELQVAGAFHSPLMKPAEDKLSAEIARVKFSDPRIPVITNVTAKPVTSAAEAKKNLVSQLTSPVRWAASMQHLVNEGYGTFAELGPGNVLAGLLKRAAKDAKLLSIGTAESVKGLVGT
ncbi:MAG: ACP S-malonyltransferase [Planctomycetes bacterium]|nr:ACP S-malonyltransferase [Planctomycetota bacterium]NUQ33468.1 ACP S-malonyltransferase [Planctomycetaceae bacterium]